MSRNIKSETIYRYDHVPGEEIDLEQEFDQKQSYREFNESGNLLLEIAYGRDGEITDKIEYRYDKAGLLLETIVYGEDDEVVERKEVVRDTGGRILRELTHYMDGSADIHEYIFDEKGNLAGLQVKDDEGELEFREHYYYEGDKVVKVERWNGDNILVFSQEDKYENGRISGREIWSAEEEEPFTIIVEFNDAGHRVQELRYNNRDQLIERNNYEEDEHGRVVQITEENRQRKNTTKFIYDDKGNVTHQSETDLNGNLNHEVFRLYSPEGALLLTTVEATMKPGSEVRAYSLIIRREMSED